MKLQLSTGSITCLSMTDVTPDKLVTLLAPVTQSSAACAFFCSISDKGTNGTKKIKATGSKKKNKKKNMSVSLATQYTENQKGTGKWKKYRYGNAPATHTHTPRQFRHLLLWCTVSNICVLTLVITIKHVDLLKIKFNATWWLSSLNHYCGWWLIDSTVPRCCRQ